MEWQPIATAPKDGTAILGYFPSGLMKVAQWIDHQNRWAGFGFGFVGTPTHWMPLPEPPKE